MLLNSVAFLFQWRQIDDGRTDRQTDRQQTFCEQKLATNWWLSSYSSAAFGKGLMATQIDSFKSNKLLLLVFQAWHLSAYVGNFCSWSCGDHPSKSSSATELATKDWQRRTNRWWHAVSDNSHGKVATRNFCNMRLEVSLAKQSWLKMQTPPKKRTRRELNFHIHSRRTSSGFFWWPVTAFPHTLSVGA